MKWFTDFDEAFAVAKSEKKTLFMLFTGSDWCPWCVKLDDEILSKPDFQRFADEELVMLYLDYPNKKQLSQEQQIANAKLSKEFGIQGYPSIVLLDNNRKVAGQTGYQRMTAAEYAEFIKKMLNK